MTVETNFYCSMNYLLNCKGDMKWEADIVWKKVSWYWRNESVYSSQSSVIYLTLYYLNNPQYSFQIWINTKKEDRETKCACTIWICLPWALFVTQGKGGVSLPRWWSIPWARLAGEPLQLVDSKTKWNRELVCQSKQQQQTKCIQKMGRNQKHKSEIRESDQEQPELQAVGWNGVPGWVPGRSISIFRCNCSLWHGSRE